MTFEEYRDLLNDYDELLKSVQEQMEEVETIEEWLELEHRLMRYRMDRAELIMHAQEEGVYIA